MPALPNPDVSEGSLSPYLLSRSGEEAGSRHCVRLWRDTKISIPAPSRSRSPRGGESKRMLATWAIGAVESGAWEWRVGTVLSPSRQEAFLERGPRQLDSRKAQGLH